MISLDLDRVSLNYAHTILITNPHFGSLKLEGAYNIRWLP